MGVSCTLLVGWLQAAVQPFCAVFVGFPAVMFCTVSVSYGPVVGLGFGCGKVATSFQLYVTFLHCGVAAWRMMGMHKLQLRPAWRHCDPASACSAHSAIC